MITHQPGIEQAPESVSGPSVQDHLGYLGLVALLIAAILIVYSMATSALIGVFWSLGFQLVAVVGLAFLQVGRLGPFCGPAPLIWSPWFVPVAVGAALDALIHPSSSIAVLLAWLLICLILIPDGLWFLSQRIGSASRWRAALSWMLLPIRPYLALLVASAAGLLYQVWTEISDAGLQATLFAPDFNQVMLNIQGLALSLALLHWSSVIKGRWGLARRLLPHLPIALVWLVASLTSLGIVDHIQEGRVQEAILLLAVFLAGLGVPLIALGLWITGLRHPASIPPGAPTVDEIADAERLDCYLDLQGTGHSLRTAIQRKPHGVFGITGVRGAGKSALGRFLLRRLSADYFTLEITAPVRADDRLGFMAALCSGVARKVVDDLTPVLVGESSDSSRIVRHWVSWFLVAALAVFVVLIAFNPIDRSDMEGRKAGENPPGLKSQERKQALDLLAQIDVALGEGPAYTGEHMRYLIHPIIHVKDQPGLPYDKAALGLVRMSPDQRPADAIGVIRRRLSPSVRYPSPEPDLFLRSALSWNEILEIMSVWWVPRSDEDKLRHLIRWHGRYGDWRLPLPRKIRRHEFSNKKKNSLLEQIRSGRAEAQDPTVDVDGLAYWVKRSVDRTQSPRAANPIFVEVWNSTFFPGVHALNVDPAFAQVIEEFRHHLQTSRSAQNGVPLLSAMILEAFDREDAKLAMDQNALRALREPLKIYIRLLNTRSAGAVAPPVRVKSVDRSENDKDPTAADTLWLFDPAWTLAGHWARLAILERLDILALAILIAAVWLLPWLWSRFEALVRTLLHTRYLGVYGEARRFLQDLGYQSSETNSGALAFQHLKLAHSQTLTARDLTLPGLTARYRRFTELVREAYGGRMIIAIDELDKVDNPEDVRRLLTEVKGALFSRGTYYLISIADDAALAFRQRLVSGRDIFESTFDEIWEIRPLTVAQASVMLERCGSQHSEIDGGRGQSRLGPDEPPAGTLGEPCRIASALFGGGVPREVARNGWDLLTAVARPDLDDDALARTWSAQILTRRVIEEWIDHLPGANLSGGEAIKLRRVAHDTLKILDADTVRAADYETIGRSLQRCLDEVVDPNQVRRSVKLPRQGPGEEGSTETSEQLELRERFNEIRLLIGLLVQVETAKLLCMDQPVDDYGFAILACHRVVSDKPALAEELLTELGSRIGNTSSCGEGRIKGNVNSSGKKLYHVPGSYWYEATQIRPGSKDCWFHTVEEARKAHFDPAGGEARQQVPASKKEQGPDSDD